MTGGVSRTPIVELVSLASHPLELESTFIVKELCSAGRIGGTVSSGGHDVLAFSPVEDN